MKSSLRWMWRKQWKNGRSFLLWGRFLTQNLARANPNRFTLDNFNFQVWINIYFVISKSYTEEKSKGCALRTITDHFYFVEIYFRRHICLVLFNKYMEAKSELCVFQGQFLTQNLPQANLNLFTSVPTFVDFFSIEIRWVDPTKFIQNEKWVSMKAHPSQGSPTPVTHT